VPSHLASLFAQRVTAMVSSPTRDLLAVGPSVISLAGGFPDTTLIPLETVPALLAAISARHVEALQYGPTDGLPAMRDRIANVMAAEGMAVSPRDVLVTTGSQQALDLVCRVLIEPGDVVITEAPTYLGALSVFTACQASVVQVELDADGIRIDLLEEALKGRKVKAIYTVPTFQNPAGVTLSLDRRRRLVEIAHERNLLILEDNPYGLLRYSGDPVAPVFALDGGERVVYLGSLSKILAPGLRLGWCAAPPVLLEKLQLMKQVADLCTGNLSQLIASTWLAEYDWHSHVAALTDVYRVRRDAMLAALSQHFPADATWTQPQGGFFVWATLSGGVDTTALLTQALGSNVAFVPGRAAYLDGRGGASMRLSFSNVSVPEIREGVARIGALLPA
jgi:2-aminoadipate transaminase